MAEAILGQNGHLAWWQECDRAVVIFVYGLILVRLAGRRVFGKWAALDIVVSIMVGSNLSRALTGSADLLGTIVATTLLMVLHWLLAHAAARYPSFGAIVEGRMVELMRGGEAKASLTSHAVSQADLDEALRQSGVEQVSDTRLIALEPSGKITVLKTQ